MSGAPAPLTLYQKIWDSYVVNRLKAGTCLLYIDLHLLHEVCSPPAFEGRRFAGLPVRQPQNTLAVADQRADR